MPDFSHLPCLAERSIAHKEYKSLSIAKGVGYTGLKLAGLNWGPVLPKFDKAKGDSKEVIEFLSHAVEERQPIEFQRRVRRKRGHKPRRSCTNGVPRLRGTRDSFNGILHGQISSIDFCEPATLNLRLCRGGIRLRAYERVQPSASQLRFAHLNPHPKGASFPLGNSIVLGGAVCLFPAWEVHSIPTRGGIAGTCHKGCQLFSDFIIPGHLAHP